MGLGAVIFFLLLPVSIEIYTVLGVHSGVYSVRSS
nr:MAG TPA: hypothetical protein [Caudoviricetes sp.]